MKENFIGKVFFRQPMARQRVYNASWHRGMEQTRGLSNKFETNMEFTLVNGRKIRLWKDAWLGHMPLKDHVLVFYYLSTRHNGSIAEFCTSQDWNLSFRRDIYDWEMERLGLFQMLSNIVLDHYKRDSISWKGHSKGIFSVTSGRNRCIQVCMLVRYVENSYC